MIETTIRWRDRREIYPEKATTVLVAVLDLAGPVWFGFTDGSAWFDAMTGEQLDHVTHWAALPMSPNPDTSAERAWDDQQTALAERGYP